MIPGVGIRYRKEKKEEPNTWWVFDVCNVAVA